MCFPVLKNILYAKKLFFQCALDHLCINSIVRRQFHLIFDISVHLIESFFLPFDPTLLVAVKFVYSLLHCFPEAHTCIYGYAFIVTAISTSHAKLRLFYHLHPLVRTLKKINVYLVGFHVIHENV